MGFQKLKKLTNKFLCARKKRGEEPRRQCHKDTIGPNRDSTKDVLLFHYSSLATKPCLELKHRRTVLDWAAPNKRIRFSKKVHGLRVLGLTHSPGPPSSLAWGSWEPASPPSWNNQSPNEATGWRRRRRAPDAAVAVFGGSYYTALARQEEEE